ncbi:MAG: hypothetical protein EON93_14635, partial [Burkholderiales bacterium]
MLQQLKALLSRSAFLTSLARKGRRVALSLAQRMGWVRLHELSAAKLEIGSLAARLSESVDAQRRYQERIARLSLDVLRQAKGTHDLEERLERQISETATVQAALVQTKQKSTAFAQQMEIWRGRAAEYKQGAGLQAEKLAASRSRIKELEQRAESLS